MKKNSKVMPRLGNFRNFIGRVVGKNRKMNTVIVEFRLGDKVTTKTFSEDSLQIVG